MTVIEILVEFDAKCQFIESCPYRAGGKLSCLGRWLESNGLQRCHPFHSALSPPPGTGPLPAGPGAAVYVEFLTKAF